MHDGVTTGNAQDDSTETRGWFIGSFIDETLGLRHSEAVEIKWGVHRAGEGRAEWVTGETRTTVAVLISGVFAMEFRDKTVRLVQQGDYVIWGEGMDHKWQVIEDCVILTVRWTASQEDKTIVTASK